MYCINWLVNLLINIALFIKHKHYFDAVDRIVKEGKIKRVNIWTNTLYYPLLSVLKENITKIIVWVFQCWKAKKKNWQNSEAVRRLSNPFNHTIVCPLNYHTLVWHSNMPPFSSTHKGCTQMEYKFVYTPGLCSASFGMWCTTQVAYRNGKMFTSGCEPSASGFERFSWKSWTSLCVNHTV